MTSKNLRHVDHAAEQKNMTEEDREEVRQYVRGKIQDEIREFKSPGREESE